MEAEIRHSVEGVERYEVSNQGRGRNRETGRMLRQVVNQDGYGYVALSKNCKGSTFTVHKSVSPADGL